MHVKARSHENRLIREPDGTITIHIAAPPTKGKANQEIVKWISRKLGLSSSKVRIVVGLHSNSKVLEILGLDESELQRRLGLSH